jgi:hypothetical protein
MADSFSYDVFLSHNAKDKPRVRQLAEHLKRRGCAFGWTNGSSSS